MKIEWTQKKFTDMKNVERTAYIATQILNEDLEPLKEKISKLISSNWDFSINICSIDSVCSNPIPIYDKEIYTSERLIISTPSTYSPKKIRFFVWLRD